MPSDRTGICSQGLTISGILVFLFFVWVIVGGGVDAKEAGDENPKPERWWLEIGSNIGYQKSNAWYADQQDFWISVLAGRGGYRFPLTNFLYLDP